MRLCILAFAHCCLMAVACGCNPEKSPATEGVRAEQLVGKWRVVRVDGKPPAELSVNSQELNIDADGKWTSKIDLAGLSLTGGGTWSLADGTISYTNGEKQGKSCVSLNSGRLVLDPDFHLRKNDATKAPVTCEYER
jgi:hypothetical protein